MGSHICRDCGGQVVAAPGVTHNCPVRERRRIEAAIEKARADVQAKADAESVQHGVITYDDHDEWLVESDAEGAARVVARDVPRWFGLLVVEKISTSAPPRSESAPDPGLRYGWHADGDLCLGPECLNYDEATDSHSTDVHSDEWWDGFTEGGRRALSAVPEDSR